MPSHDHVQERPNIRRFHASRFFSIQHPFAIFSSVFPFIFLILFCSMPATAAKKIYVDSEQPNDSLDGSSPKTAWKTTQNLKKAKIQPGDSILFRRGGIWKNEQIEFQKGGLPGALVFIGSYGNKNQPKPHFIDSSANVIAISASHIVVSGLKTTGARRYGITTKGRNLHNLTIMGNEISDCTNGILINQASQVILSENNIHTIHYNRSHSGAIGITLDRSRDVKIISNKFRNCIGTQNSHSDGGAIELFRSNQGIQIFNNQAFNTWGFIEMGGLSGDSIRDVHISANTAINTRSFAWFNLDTPTDTSNYWGVGYDSILISNNTLIQNKAHTSNAIGSNENLTNPNQIIVKNNIFAGDSLNDFNYKGNFHLINNIFWSKSKKPKQTFPPTNRFINPQIIVDTNRLTYFTHPDHKNVGSPQSRNRN